MVFSFFKKDPREAKGRSAKGVAGARPARPAPAKAAGKPVAPKRPVEGPEGPSTRFAMTDNAIPERDLARSLAMETAAKIDRIESEMARDFVRRSPGTDDGAAATGSAARASIAARPARAAEHEGLDHASDLAAGNIDAIELHAPGVGAIVDETAILFANGLQAEAEATLRAGLDSGELGSAEKAGWSMLFELVNQRGDRQAFEQLSMQYALRFEDAPPGWIDYADATPSAASASVPAPAAAGSGPPAVPLPAAIDANVVKALEQVKVLAARHPALTLDLTAAQSIDLIGAELLLRVVNAFKRSSHELTLLGAEHLLDPLRAAVEPGRRDTSDAGWMLLLELLRLSNRQHDFEETAIQYCITFEVSPPQWEPAPVNVKLRSAPARTAAAAGEPGVFDPLAWFGVIDDEGEPWFGRMLAEARTRKQLSVDCRHLRRMAFAAASTLLTHAMKLQQAGVTLELRDVNTLIGALLQLLGVAAVARVQLRRG